MKNILIFLTFLVFGCKTKYHLHKNNLRSNDFIDDFSIIKVGRVVGFDEFGVPKKFELVSVAMFNSSNSKKAKRIFFYKGNSKGKWLVNDTVRDFLPNEFKNEGWYIASVENRKDRPFRTMLFYKDHENRMEKYYRSLMYLSDSSKIGIYEVR